MCNLYRMTSGLEAMQRLFLPAGRWTANLPRFDEIYPRQDAPVIRLAQGDRVLETMRWGFPLAQPGRAVRPVTNVRNTASRFWRDFVDNPTNRCLVPVTAFCEWTDARPKRKVWFRIRDAELFSFAGLWRETGDGHVYAFLTTEANSLVAPVHAKAMPVILGPEDHERWLKGDARAARALQRPYPADRMTIVAG